MPVSEIRFAFALVLSAVLMGCGDAPSQGETPLEKSTNADTETVRDAGADLSADKASEPAPEDEGIETYGLPPGEGRDEVIAYCGACHSMRLVTQQGLSRDDWQKMLKLMYDEHGMPPLEPDVEKRVLDYLAEHLDPESQKERLRAQGIIR